MIPKIVASTLAALNSLVAPFGSGPSTLADSYRFDIKSAPTVATACMTAAARPVLRVKLEEAGELTLRVRVQSRLCGIDHRVHNASAQFILPLEVFDADFMKNLGELRPYILTGIDDPDHPELKSRLKVTRLQDAGSDLTPTHAAPVPIRAPGSIVEKPKLVGFVLEWIANTAQGAPGHPPLTIWLKRGADNSVLQTFPWEKFEFTMEASAPTAQGMALAASVHHPDSKGRSVAGSANASGSPELDQGRLTAELHPVVVKAKTLR